MLTMQYQMDMEGRTGLLRKVDDLLSDHFHGFPPRYVRLDSVSQLVMSLLGGQTYSDVSRTAHTNLITRFGTWANVRDAEMSAIKHTIRHVTFPEKKAERLINILDGITNADGQPDLDHLENLSVAEGHAFLERLDGVGPKIAAAVLNTSTLRKRSLVIDTHHLRILVRLRLIPLTASFVKAYQSIMPAIPEEWTAARIDRHHMLFKRLGQVTCRPQRAHCHCCPLQTVCQFDGAEIVRRTETPQLQ